MTTLKKKLKKIIKKKNIKYSQIIKLLINNKKTCKNTKKKKKTRKNYKKIRIKGGGIYLQRFYNLHLDIEIFKKIYYIIFDEIINDKTHYPKVLKELENIKKLIKGLNEGLSEGLIEKLNSKKIKKLRDLIGLSIFTDLIKLIRNYNNNNVNITNLNNFLESESYKFILKKINELINLWYKIDQRKPLYLLLKVITKDIELIETSAEIKPAITFSREKYEDLDIKLFDTLAYSEENVTKLVEFLKSLIYILNAKGDTVESTASVSAAAQATGGAGVKKLSKLNDNRSFTLNGFAKLINIPINKLVELMNMFRDVRVLKGINTYIIVFKIINSEYYKKVIGELTKIQNTNSYKIQDLMNFYESEAEALKFISIKISELIDIWGNKKKVFKSIFDLITHQKKISLIEGENGNFIRMPQDVGDAIMSAQEIYDTLADNEEDVTKLVNFLNSLIYILNTKGFSHFYKMIDKDTKKTLLNNKKIEIKKNLLSSKVMGMLKNKYGSHAAYLFERPVMDMLKNKYGMDMLKNKYGSHAAYLFELPPETDSNDSLKRNKTEKEKEREEEIKKEIEKKKREVLNKYLGPEITMKAENNLYKYFGGAKQNKTRKKK